MAATLTIIAYPYKYDARTIGVTVYTRIVLDHTPNDAEQLVTGCLF